MPPTSAHRPLPARLLSALLAALLAAAGILLAPLTALAAAPDAPTLVSAATAGPSLATVTWSPGASSATGYRVQVRSDGGAFEDAAISSTTTATLFGLAPETAYEVRVIAFDVDGDSAPSNTEAFITPASDTGVGTVAELSATAGDREVTLTWALIDPGTSPMGYVVALREPGGLWNRATTTIDGAAAVVTGLTNGTAYEFLVVPMGYIGGWVYGAAAHTTGTPVALSPASPPISLTATPQDGSAHLAWGPPGDDGGAPVTSYVIERRESGGSWIQVGEISSSSLSDTVGGLTNGTTYEFTVSAVTAHGPGTPAVASATPAGLPTAPVADLAAGVERALLSWAPSDGNGRDVEAYIIERLMAGSWLTIARIDQSAGPTLEVEYSGLAGGESVTFRVSAETSMGIGEPSVPVTALIASPGGDGDDGGQGQPGGLPGAPEQPQQPEDDPSNPDDTDTVPEPAPRDGSGTDRLPDAGVDGAASTIAAAIAAMVIGAALLLGRRRTAGTRS